MLLCMAITDLVNIVTRRHATRDLGRSLSLAALPLPLLLVFSFCKCLQSAVSPLCFPKTATHADYLSYIIEIGHCRRTAPPLHYPKGGRGETPKSVRSKPAFFFRWRHFHLVSACGASDALISVRRFTRLEQRKEKEREGEEGRVASFWRAFPPLIRIVRRTRGALCAGATELK